MRRVNVLIGTVLVLLGSEVQPIASRPDAAPQIQEWTEVKSSEGGFRVLFPSTPMYAPQEVPTALGPIRMHRWSLEVGERFFQLIYAEYPAAHVQSLGAAQMLDNAVNRMRESIKAGSVFERDVAITLAGHPGREHVHDVDGYMMKGRSLVVGTKLYQVLGGVPSAGRAGAIADIDRFLASFAITAGY